MKHRTITTSAPYLIEELEIELHIGGKHVASAFQREIPVTVDFTYQPGYAGTFGGAMEDAEQGMDPEIDILAVKPTLQAFIDITDEDETVLGTLVIDAGRCLLPILTDDMIEDIEKMVDNYMTEGEDV